jgi:UDP-3-O-[3-hydroxymyristoyl] glucosamine N-acyltransferase
MFTVRAGELVDQLGGELIGDPAIELRCIAPLEAADAHSISFLSNPRLQTALADSAAGCVIVAPAARELPSARRCTIVTDDPYRYYARLSQWWAGHTRARPAPGVHPSAVVDPAAVVHAGATVGALAVVEAGAVFAQGAQSGAQCHIGAGAVIGADTRLMAHVVFGANCRIGARSIVHSGTVIGADGFGFAPGADGWEKIEQLGAVRIGDDVEIGANCCIDRGALADTVIEQGVKMDNLIQVGHNVHIGAHTALAGCVGIAGSSHIGAHCTIGGGVGITGHVRIVDRVHIGGATVVTRSILKPGSYGGVFPFDDNGVWEKNAATLRQLHALRARVRSLEQHLEHKD